MDCTDFILKHQSYKAYAFTSKIDQQTQLPACMLSNNSTFAQNVHHQVRPLLSSPLKLSLPQASLLDGLTFKA